MNNNNNQKLKAYIQELLQPVFDELVEYAMLFTDTFLTKLPQDMSDDKKKEVIDSILKAHSESLKARIKSAVPEDFLAKVKEVANGKK